MNRSAILFSGGYNHPFAQSSPALASIADEAGWQTQIEEDFESVLEALPNVSLLLINALYWSMTQNEKYVADRYDWAFSLSDRQMAVIDQFISSGGRLFVLHVVTICWDTQPQWRTIMGGGWQWGRSYHPPMGQISIDVTPAGTALGAMKAAFDLIDEAYHHLEPGSGCTILATCTIEDGAQPLAWTKTYRAGRVAVDALGHDARSLTEPGHHSLISAMLRWLAVD